MSMIERCKARIAAMNMEFNLNWEIVRNDVGVYVIRTKHMHTRIMFPMATAMRVHYIIERLEAEMRVSEMSRKYFQSKP